MSDTSNIPQPERSSKNLPSTVAAALPAQVARCKQLQQALSALVAHVDAIYLGYAVIIKWKDQTDIAAAQAALAAVQQAGADLPAVSRAATADEIASRISLLLDCFPKAQRKGFARQLCEDVGDEHPSFYALELACRRLRRTHKFPDISIADVIDALQAETQHASRHQDIVAELPNLQQRLVEHAKAREDAKQEAERLAEAELAAAEEEEADAEEDAEEEEEDDWDNWLIRIEADRELSGLPRTIARILFEHYLLTPNAPWPSIQTLAQKLMVDRISVRRALQRLGASGLRRHVDNGRGDTVAHYWLVRADDDDA